MQTNVILPLNERLRQTEPVSFQPDYAAAEQQFIQLLETEELDRQIWLDPHLAKDFESALSVAIQKTYLENTEDEAAHRFLQRILYRINRLNLFWYDDLRHYLNERSLYIASIRQRIEADWQGWELAQLTKAEGFLTGLATDGSQLPPTDGIASLQQIDVRQALQERAEADLNPPLSVDTRYLREQMSEAGYRHLLAIASFDGLVEASRLSRILGGAANEVQCTLVRVLLEEYGNGRLARKHSTFFARMMAELELNTEPEGYFDIVPWQVLASINHNFLLTECKRYFLRYNGGLTYFEVAGPSVYRNYLNAAQRLGLSEAAMGYWELHIREDERHGRWMLEEVALPLAEKYPNEAWELVLGYDQEKFIGERAAAAVVRSIHQVEESNA